MSQNVVPSRPDLWPHARDMQWSELSDPPPELATDRAPGGAGPMLTSPLRALGRYQDALRDLYGATDASSWRGKPFEMGRAPFDSNYCEVWRALFKPFAPLERILAPAYRHLLS